jgi:superfamily II DNA/RNA helicase
MSIMLAQLALPNTLVVALERNGITEPFPIQAATIPDAMAGRDVAGMAPTGSGKTLAFGLPILARVEVAQPRRPRALVLSPTRELAAQIRKDLAPYGKATKRQVFAVYGGVRYQAQRDWLNRGVDVLVATPGRLEDLIDQGVVDLSDVNIVAVDEADRMADMGFLPPVRRILDQTSSDRQTMLFSATLDGDVGVLIREYQHQPARHDAGDVEPDTIEAQHHFWHVDRNDKIDHAASIVRSQGSTIVFTRTRHGADRLAKQLAKMGVGAVAMHGGRSQGQRNKALAAFASGDADALVATDVAARGIHIDAVASVLHFDPPNGHKDYVHRSGRTARAGASGNVVSLVTRGERRAIGRMQRQLDLHQPIVDPNVGLLGTPDLRVTPKKRSVVPDEPRPRSQRTHTKPRTNESGPVTDPTVFVGNLPWKTTDQELRRLFGKYGSVHAASVKMDRRGRSKGVALIAMHPSDARQAIRALDGRKIGGRPMKVRLAQPVGQRR